MFYAPGHVFGGTEGVGSRFHVLRARTRFQRERGCRVPFPSFALPESFSVVQRASGRVFMFCAPGLIFGGCLVLLSCFALPNMFFAVPSASGYIFMFCPPRLIFGGPEGDVFCFHVLHAGTNLWRYHGRRVPFSFFALPDTFSTVRRGVRSRFHVLHALTHFRRKHGYRVPVSSFARPNSFSTVPRVMGLVFMFCASGLFFGGTEGVGSRFLVLFSRTHFRRYRGRRLPFSCFARPDLFSAVPRASGPVF
jgi:hypothetical protein